MSQQGVYGFPCVSDPHDFSPDAECCSPEEMAAHKLACETYGTPTYQPNKGCFSQYDETGKLVLHVTRTSWGIGLNSYSACDGCGEPGDQLTTCHECGPEFCGVCWPEHEKEKHAP